MAKGNMEPYQREPFSCQAQDGTAPDDQPDMPASSLVQDSDYVPPNSKSAPKSRVAAEDEDEAPLKSRIALGYLTVNGREEPIFAPIQGFEHLFNPEDAAISWPSQKATQVRGPQSPAESARHQPVATQKKRGRKRRRPREEDEHGAQDADEESEAGSKIRIPRTFSIGDIESLKTFYAARFRELTMKPMRDVVTAWVKRLEPRRQKKYGPYQRYESDSGLSNLRSGAKPPWWPADIPYIEPSHLKLQHLVPLAVDIMLIHRHIDEQVGKRKYASWISELETDAVYLISSKDTDHFSSSRGAKYNEAMKTRALDVILPSVFDIAKSHEDYIAQYDLYEGSGNEDPGCGKQVSWQATPRPERGLIYKRPCPPSKSGSPREDNGDDTEMDEEPTDHNSAMSSFESTFSYTEDVKMFPDPVTHEPSPVTEVIPVTVQPVCPPQICAPALDRNMVSTVDHSMGRLQIYEVPQEPRPPFYYNQPDLSYYPQYNPMLQVPYVFPGPNGFPACEAVMPSVVPHGAALTSAPDSSKMIHGLPMHHLPVHDFPTHGLPSPADWNQEY